MLHRRVAQRLMNARREDADHSLAVRACLEGGMATPVGRYFTNTETSDGNSPMDTKACRTTGMAGGVKYDGSSDGI